MLFKGLIGLAFLILIFVIGVQLNSKPAPTSNSSQPTPKGIFNSTPTQNQISLKVLGWIPYWDQKTAFESFSKNVELLDFVSVFWYRIDAAGNLTKYKQTVEDQSIINFAHQNKVKVLAVVANLPDYEEGGDWDHKRVNLVISTPQTRSKHISNLLSLVEKNNFDGVNIDYEALKASQRENFSLFIEELANELHKNGKILGVAIHPKTSEFNPTEDNGSHAQDLARIAKSADQLYFMNYTQHSISSQPGPVGSADWISRVMTYAINEVRVPKEKIFAGIGLFGLEWHQTGQSSFYGDNDDLTAKQTESIIKNDNIEVQWDNQTKSPNFTYQKLGEKHIVWFENTQSVSERIKLAKELGIGSIAFWRLGSEDPKIWEIVKNNKVL